MAAGGAGWFASKYFASNYWADEYWAEAGGETGGYWPWYYWAANYWATDYWAQPVGEVGDVTVTDDATLTLTEYVPSVTAGPVILASTAAFTLTALDTDANIDIVVSATTGSLTLSITGLDIGTSGYILGDIEVAFRPVSDITITYGMVTEAQPRTLTAFHPTTNTVEGIDIGVGPPTSLGLNAFDVIANNTVAVEPLPQSLSLTAYDSPAAGIGWLIQPEKRPMDVSGIPVAVSGVPLANVAVGAVVEVIVDGLSHTISGRPAYTLPPPTFEGDYSILNPFSGVYPSNYEICDRTGFRVRRGGLREEWTGLRVRDGSWERRNAQDFVRGVGDEQEGSPRPEQTDRFVYEDYPAGVTADDL